MSDNHRQPRYIQPNANKISEGFSALALGAGFLLDKEEDQVHIGGERVYTSPRKFVLKARRMSDGMRVIVKASSFPDGIREIGQERRARQALGIVNRSQQGALFLYPEELFFFESNEFALAVTEFIEQPQRFTCRPLSEKYETSLKALHTQEAITLGWSAQFSPLADQFQVTQGVDYAKQFEAFLRNAANCYPQHEALAKILDSAFTFFLLRQTAVETQCGYLVHSDFAPQNFRIVDHELCYLDLGAFHFGNKYESWARYLNWLMLYDRPLEAALRDHLRRSISAIEENCLAAMSAFKISFYIHLYSSIIPQIKTNRHLLELQQSRLLFWTMALGALVSGETVSADTIEQHVKRESMLRSDHERRRQSEL